MRHVPRTHGHDLDELYERMTLDPAIEFNYVNNSRQLVFQTQFHALVETTAIPCDNWPYKLAEFWNETDFVERNLIFLVVRCNLRGTYFLVQ